MRNHRDCSGLERPPPGPMPADGTPGPQQAAFHAQSPRLQADWRGRRQVRCPPTGRPTHSRPPSMRNHRDCSGLGRPLPGPMPADGTLGHSRPPSMRNHRDYSGLGRPPPGPMPAGGTPGHSRPPSMRNHRDYSGLGRPPPGPMPAGGTPGPQQAAFQCAITRLQRIGAAAARSDARWRDALSQDRTRCIGLHYL